VLLRSLVFGRLAYSTLFRPPWEFWVQGKIGGREIGDGLPEIHVAGGQ